MQRAKRNLALTAILLIAAWGPSADADELKPLLEQLAAGKGDANGLRLKAKDLDAGFDVEVFGSGVGFVGDVQVKLGLADVAALVKKLTDAKFADMPGGFGGVGRPGMGVPERLVRSIELRVGAATRTVTQLAGGEQSKALADLVADVHKLLQPLAAKGVDLGKLTLEQALEGLAKGDVAPEAVSLALTVSPRKPGGKQDFFRFTDAVVMVFDAKHVEKPMPRTETEALSRRIGALLAGKGLDKMPKQLWWPDSLIGLSLSVRGNKEHLSLSADTGPYNQKLKAEHPAEQKTFEDVVRGLMAIEQEVQKGTPTSQSAGAEAMGIEMAKKGDRADVLVEGGRTAVDVHSESGIGGATVERRGERWPAGLALRLHLGNLESLAIDNGRVTLRGRVRGQGPVGSVSVRKDDKESDPLDANSPYWTEIRILDKSGRPIPRLPIRGNGEYFEVTIPPAMLGADCRSLKIGWIDSFRG